MIKSISSWLSQLTYTIVVILVLSIAYIAHANHTQSAMYSQELPPNRICIMDTYGYIQCIPDATVPWYIKPVGVLAHVE